MFFLHQKNEDQFQQLSEHAGAADKNSTPGLKNDYGSIEHERAADVEDKYAETSFKGPGVVNEDLKIPVFFRTKKKTKGAMFLLVSFLLLTGVTMVAVIDCGSSWFPSENENSFTSASAPSSLQSKDVPGFGQPAEFSVALMQDAMQPANSAQSCIDIPEQDSPDYAKILINGIELLSGLPLNNFVEIVQELSGYYSSCNIGGEVDKKLEIQRERIRLEMRQNLNFDSFNDAYIAANNYFDLVRGYKGDTSLDEVPWVTLDGLSNDGISGVLSTAKSAGILGAEIYSKVAILVHSILLFQLRKADDHCDGTVHQIMDNIKKAVDHIGSLIQLTSTQSGQFSCRLLKDYNLRPGSDDLCYGGECICEPSASGTIVFDVEVHYKGGKKSAQTKYVPCRYPSSYCTGFYRRVCPVDSYRGQLIGEGRNAFNADFLAKRDLWLNGHSNVADDQGIQFFYDQFKNIQTELNKIDLEKKCGSTLSPSSSSSPSSSPTPNPTPNPTPAPTNFCHPSGYRCGWQGFTGARDSSNCAKCCKTPGDYVSCSYPEANFASGYCCK